MMVVASERVSLNAGSSSISWVCGVSSASTPPTNSRRFSSDAVLDVSRKLAGWRLRRLRALAATPPTVVAPPAPALVVQRVNRRSAADALAEAGTRKGVRTP